MTTVSSQPPLDEIQWRSPFHIQQLGGLNSTTVMHYFRQSPFFDSTSNNAILEMQAMNPAINHIMRHRSAFEGRLKNMVGVEFVVAEENPNSALWVIKKQMRRSPTVAESLGVYFVVGENIYMGPSVYAIAEARMLSISKLLMQAQQLAASVAEFSPAAGYSYLPHSMTAASSAAVALGSMSQQSLSSTPAPQAPSTTNNMPPSSVDRELKREEQSLFASLNTSLRYTNTNSGFMEDTLITDPNQLMISNSGSNSQVSHQASQQSPQSHTQTAAQALKQQQEAKGKEKDLKLNTAVPESKAGKTISPTSPGGTKKRRKSKVILAGTLG